jgi:hypothetical protein
MQYAIRCFRLLAAMGALSAAVPSSSYADTFWCTRTGCTLQAYCSGDTYVANGCVNSCYTIGGGDEHTMTLVGSANCGSGGGS